MRREYPSQYPLTVPIQYPHSTAQYPYTVPCSTVEHPTAARAACPAAQIFPRKYRQFLPTFCSSAIECFIDRIPALSEQFVCVRARACARARVCARSLRVLCARVLCARARDGLSCKCAHVCVCARMCARVQCVRARVCACVCICALACVYIRVRALIGCVVCACLSGCVLCACVGVGIRECMCLCVCVRACVRVFICASQVYERRHVLFQRSDARRLLQPLRTPPRGNTSAMHARAHALTVWHWSRLRGGFQAFQEAWGKHECNELLLPNDRGMA
jgi:hypothetical protein